MVIIVKARSYCSYLVIDSLPLELQRSFALLKELDDMLSGKVCHNLSTATNLVAQVDNLRTSANDYRAQVASLSTSERMERRRRIRKHTRESIKIAEEKVGLSRSTYDIVSKTRFFINMLTLHRSIDMCVNWMKTFNGWRMNKFLEVSLSDQLCRVSKHRTCRLSVGLAKPWIQ